SRRSRGGRHAGFPGPVSPVARSVPGKPIEGVRADRRRTGPADGREPGRSRHRGGPAERGCQPSARPGQFSGDALAAGPAAAYVVTGSVNQSCVGAGQSPLAKELLAAVGTSDCVLAPSADMFELDVNVQVLQRGTMFAGRARRLYELYRANDSIESIT